MKKLCLIDGSGFIFRAFHALPPLTTKDGTPVNAVYGFTKAIMQLKEQKDIEYLLVVFDSSRISFRQNIYVEYKAHRPPPPAELIPQFALIKQVPKALNVASIEIEGFEADDIIATYSNLGKKLGLEIEIVSSDKDLMQLIDDTKNVYMYDPLKRKKITQADVLEKFGVHPNLVIDAQALIGDASDNVPGVLGVGPKTASDLLNRFGSLENIYNNISEILKPNLKEKLVNNKEMAFISKKLVTLEQNINFDNVAISQNTTPDSFDIKNYSLKPYIFEELYSFLNSLSFNSLMANIAKINNHSIKDFINETNKLNHLSVHKPIKDNDPIKAIATTNILISSINDLKIAIDNLINLRIKYRVISCIFNSDTSLSIGNEIYNYSINIKKEQFSLLDNSTEQDITHSVLLEVLLPLLKNQSITKVFFSTKDFFNNFKSTNLNKDLWFYINELNNYEDVSLLHYLISGSLNTKDFKQQLFEILKNNYLVNENDEALEINSNLLINLYNIYFHKIVENKNYSLYCNFDKPLIKVLALMESVGILVDKNILYSLSQTFAQQIQTIEKEIFASSGGEFNLASPKQVGEVLFEKLQIDGKKHKTGAWITDSEALEDIVNNEKNTEVNIKIASLILQWRQLFKLKTTYTDSLMNDINPNTRRIHSEFFQCAVNTGRLSSQHPNLQNIPIKTKEGKLIRGAFVAKAGYKLISLDYSQIELRLLAIIAGVKNLETAFLKNLDIHKQTASEIFGVVLNDVSDDLRRSAKAINFGIIYGQSAFGLASALGISKGDAKKYIDGYFASYPEIKNYMESTINEAKQYGFVQTLFGRKCFLNNINSKNFMAKAGAERGAINAKIQGSAADVVRLAMIMVNEHIEKNNYKASLLLQIHDELIIECEETIAEKLAQELQQIMQSVATFNIPLIVDYSIGNSWLG
jgi:DNA polymerase-1